MCRTQLRIDTPNYKNRTKIDLKTTDKDSHLCQKIVKYLPTKCEDKELFV